VGVLADHKELQPLVGQWGAPLSNRVAANTAMLESGTVPTDHSALLALIDSLSAFGMSVIGVEDLKTPVACMRAATLVLSVRTFSYPHSLLNFPPI
jgi:hypothetical protein